MQLYKLDFHISQKVKAHMIVFGKNKRVLLVNVKLWMTVFCGLTQKHNFG